MTTFSTRPREQHFADALFHVVYTNVSAEHNFQPRYTIVVYGREQSSPALTLTYDHHRNLVEQENHGEFTGHQVAVLQAHFKLYMEHDAEGDVIQHLLDRTQHGADEIASHCDKKGAAIFSADIDELRA